VITPVVETMLRHREGDPKRLALIGVSQGGYWVPRALAFEPRIAAGVPDPGVWDVSDLWLRNLPTIIRDPPRSDLAATRRGHGRFAGGASGLLVRDWIPSTGSASGERRRGGQP
jgi:hypothetical protein